METPGGFHKLLTGDGQQSSVRLRNVQTAPGIYLAKNKTKWSKTKHENNQEGNSPSSIECQCFTNTVHLTLFSQPCCPQLFHYTQITIYPGCWKWLHTAGKSLFLAYSLSIFAPNTFLTCWSDSPLAWPYQDEGKESTVNQGLLRLAPSECLLKESLNLSTSTFSQEITAFLWCSNKYLLLPMCKSWFYGEPGRSRINYSIHGMCFGKIKPPKIKPSQAELLHSGLCSCHPRSPPAQLSAQCMEAQSMGIPQIGCW